MSLTGSSSFSPAYGLCYVQQCLRISLLIIIVLVGFYRHFKSKHIFISFLKMEAIIIISFGDKTFSVVGPILWNS
jgi:hypothetical protein